MEHSLTSLSEALPVEGRASALRIGFNSSLIDSFKYLLEVCEPVVPSSVFQLASENINRLNQNLKISGLTAGLHADLFNAIEKENTTKVNKVVSTLSTAHLQVDEIKYMSFSSLNDYSSSIIQHIFSQEYIHPITFHSLSSEKYEKVKASLEKSYEIYKDVVPNFHQEFQEMVSEILVLNADGLKQGSSSDLFGMLYKCCLYKWEKVSDVFEFLTHEQSHLYVHLLNKDDPLVLNPT